LYIAPDQTVRQRMSDRWGDRLQKHSNLATLIVTSERVRPLLRACL